jgi:hypothetical protein
MNEFDIWRQKYESMTYQEQIEYHNDIERRFPEQAHYTYGNVKYCLNMAGENLNVLEFGCWKGDMAERALLEHSVKDWKGIEICTAAIEKTRCVNPKFSYIVPEHFNWFETTTRPECDIILATHFIEHLSNPHFESLANYCKGAKWVYFEAPLIDVDREWNGYVGTHKLNYGWSNIIGIMSQKGYEVVNKFPEGVFFKSAL